MRAIRCWTDSAGAGPRSPRAQRLGRQWIGIDVTHLAITLIRHRLFTAYGPQIEDTFTVTGEPVELPDAEQLAQEDPHQFQIWALGKVGARPTELKKGADRGIDGRLYFHDTPGGDAKLIVISVKGGERISSPHVRDLRGVVEREGAAIGALLTLHAPTRDMVKEAASAGFYTSAWGKHPRLQILTIEQLLTGAGIDYPPARQTNVTFKPAPAVRPKPKPKRLPFELEAPVEKPRPKQLPIHLPMTMARADIQPKRGKKKTS